MILISLARIKWPLRLYGPFPALAIVSGIAVLQFFSTLPSLRLIGGSCAVLALLCWQTRGNRLTIFALLFVCGAFYATWRADLRLQNTLPSSLIWQDIQIEGIVNGPPIVDAERTRFDFSIQRITAPLTLTLNLQARLSDYHRGNTPTLSLFTDGAYLRLYARLRPPGGRFNPHNADYAGGLFARNIRLMGYVRSRYQATILASGGKLGIRQRLERQIQNSAADHTALIKALVIGKRDDISDDEWTVLRRTGTAHLISISGAHIGFLYLLATWLALLLWRTHKRLSWVAPAMKIALLIALPVAAIYAWLAGFGVPVQRSLIMLIVVAIGVWLGGTHAATTALTTAMLIVVIINPWALLSAGFWLSFLLTGVLLFAVLKTTPKQSRLWALLKMQCLLSLLAMPLTLWFFNEASLVSPVANIVAIPIIGFIVLPLALAGIAIGDFAWLPAGEVLDILWSCLSFLAALPYAAWSPAQVPVGFFLLAVGGGMWLLMPRGVPLRLAGVLPIIGVLLYTPPPPDIGHLRLSFLDVGQGSAVVLQTTHHTLVYDTGRRYGGRIVANYLRGRGIRQLDTLVLSHDDDDHRGGSNVLLSDFPANTIIASDGDQRCRRGLSWQWDGITFSVLHPNNTTSRNDNDNSCVLAVSIPHRGTILFTGDISATIEKSLLPNLSKLTLLHIPHHGSRHSSSRTFLKKTKPVIAVISTGRNNYGHPHPQTLERLQNAGSTVYRTDKHGALTIEIGETTTITAWRQVLQRYWHN